MDVGTGTRHPLPGPCGSLSSKQLSAGLNTDTAIPNRPDACAPGSGLWILGQEPTAEEVDAAGIIRSVAAGKVTEEQLATWISERVRST
jgi:hypothetical protein